MIVVMKLSAPSSDDVMMKIMPMPRRSAGIDVGSGE